jgi:TolB-like protein/Flp pilus assembly protein TadD
MSLDAPAHRGPYRIEALIGAGGMGRVYRARDTRLQRLVAIKILAESPDTDGARLRLLAEARAASALNHPNICTVYEVGELDGQPFIAMELVEGRTLTDAIPPDGLPAAAVCRYGAQVAAALGHAHDRGIVHRDLKSANVFLTSDGRAKVLDFGLAVSLPASEDQTASAQFLTTDVVAGTLAYMPPEVLQGRSAGAASDVWSLGVLLYEMTEGVLPFRAATVAALSAAILGAEPPPMSRAVPPGLRNLIARCLRKAAGERYARAGEVASALEALGDDAGRRQERAEAAPMRSIAVLPFHDLSQDPSNTSLAVGLADATITELALVKALLVRPTAAILRYRDSPIDPVQAGLELGVYAVVHGTFQRSGPRVRVTVQLVATSDGRSLWGTKVSTSLDDVFEIQDEVSRQVAGALQVELTQGDERRLAHAPRVAGEAYALYAEGRLHAFHESVEHVSKAVELFERAVEADAGFAQAHASLADVYLRVAHTWDPDGDWRARAERANERALALDADLPEGHHVRGRLAWSAQAGFNHAAAIRAFMAAIAGRPSLNEAHHWLGIVLFHVGLMERSLIHFERAIAISPNDLVALLHEGYCQYLLGDFPRAAALSRAAMTRTPSLWTCYQLALAEIQIGALDEAEQTVSLAARTYPGDVLCYPIRGLVAARRGDIDEADRQVELTVRNKRAFGHYHHAQYDVACIHALAGRRSLAIEWLTAAARNGFPCAAFFERDPLLASIRGEAAYRTLMQDLAAECASYERLYRDLGESSAS